jgi:hypothetical protein
MKCESNGRLFSVGSCLPPLFPIFPSVRHSQRSGGKRAAFFIATICREPKPIQTDSSRLKPIQADLKYLK